MDSAVTAADVAVKAIRAQIEFADEEVARHLTNLADVLATRPTIHLVKFSEMDSEGNVPYVIEHPLFEDCANDLFNCEIVAACAIYFPSSRPATRRQVGVPYAITLLPSGLPWVDREAHQP